MTTESGPVVPDPANPDLAERRAAEGFATRAIHAGYTPDPGHGAVNPPIVASSTFAQDGYAYIADQVAGVEAAALEANLEDAYKTRLY